MKRSLLRVMALGATGLAGATGLVLGAGAASAATPTTIGTLSLSPGAGTAGTPANLVTSGGCPAGDTFVSGVVNSTNAGWTNIVALGTTDVGISNSGSFTEPMADSLFSIAQTQSLTLAPGKYTFSLFCRPDGLSAPDSAFVGSIYYTGTASQGALQPYVSAGTTLAVSPTSPANHGQAVTLTANVAPSTSLGTVTFKDGNTALGAPVAVSNGTAVLPAAVYADGGHTFTAVYSGSADADPSTSAVQNYTVTAPVPPGTSTVTLGGPATANVGVPAHFTVTTTPVSGTVKLICNGATIGTGTVTNGTATIDGTFTSASATSVVTAHFVAAGNFSASDSSPVTVNVTTPPTAPVSQTIETSIAAGSLVMSIADTTTVVLPTPVLDPNAGFLTSTGAIHPVTVTDTRAGAPGFAVTGLATDFVNAHGDKIDGANLGWTPNIVDATGGMVITLGAHVGAAPAIQPGGTSDPSLGIKTSRTLATNAPGHNGTTHLGANLELAAPTSTQVGTYDSTLTLTAI